MDLWTHLSKQISLQTQQHFKMITCISVGGGCINNSYHISDNQCHYFVKLNQANKQDMFEAEAEALKQIHHQGVIRVPEPVCYGQYSSQSFLVLEYLTLSGQVDSVTLGRQLAAMHKITAPQFGWTRPNTIGATPQHNKPTSDWLTFWREQRMQPQLALAQKNGFGHALKPIIDKLLPTMHHLFENHSSPQPSMLHGDLWGGNVAALSNGTPVIYDPAFYYGDRETDIAMSRLFGGFDKHFYNAYNEAWPLDDGFSVRQDLYNLYHIINHLNLFGESYLSQTINLSERLLAHI